MPYAEAGFARLGRHALRLYAFVPHISLPSGNMRLHSYSPADFLQVCRTTKRRRGHKQATAAETQKRPLLPVFPTPFGFFRQTLAQKSAGEN